MTAIRRRVRAVAIAWLLCQVATLSAFVPEECCVSHAAEAAARDKAEACHEAEPPAPKPEDACPMHDTEGAACPMHQSKSHDGCAMSNACEGPGTHLLGLFAFLGVLGTPVTSSTVLESSPVFVPSPASPLHRLATPDAPPPKA